MIKVDIVTGFLGAGKTTLIIKLFEVLKAHGEKIVIIENEFGETGIDNVLLSGEGYKVYEIENGCICCTMKSDFAAAFSEIADKIKPDRILIEPSGIFVLDSILDVFQYPEIKNLYVLNSVLTLVDARHYMRHEAHYAEFIHSQVQHASALLLTKTKGLQEITIEYVLESLKKLNIVADIVTDYTRLDINTLKSLLDGKCCGCAHHASDETHTCCDEHTPCSHDDTHTTHTHFETLLLKPQEVYSREAAEEKLNLLRSQEYGSIIRVKGFLKAAKGYLNVNYVDGDISVNMKLRELPITLEFIGVGLNTEKLRALFND